MEPSKISLQPLPFLALGSFFPTTLPSCQPLSPLGGRTTPRNRGPAFAILTSPGLRVEVTVIMLVPRARLPAWSREPAATALGTRFDVIPFGRLLPLSAL